MMNRRSVGSVRALAPAKLLFLIGLLIPGSVALSQPFPSFMLDSTLDYIPAFDEVGGIRGAFGPDIGLVVWTSHGVRGVRLDRSSGALLDTLQIVICEDYVSAGQCKPGIAWSGHNFLVAWAGAEAAAAIVEPDGRVTSRIVFQDSEVLGRGAAVAFDGTNFLVTWVAASETVGMTACFCRVSPQGVVLDSPPRMVAPLSSGRQASTALCFYDDRYLVVWSDWDTLGISGNFIRPDGSIADSTGFNIRSGVYPGDPAVTHDRNNFLVSWDEWENRYYVKLARVSDSGAVIDTGGVVIDSSAFAETEVTSNGDTTLFLFRRDTLGSRDSLTLVAVRLDSALNRLDAEPVKLSAPGYDGYGYAAGGYSAALCGDDYLVTWTQPLAIYPVDDRPQALCRRVSRSGVPLDSAPVILSYGVPVQTNPDISSDGEDFMAAWNEKRRDSASPALSVYCSRFSTEGPLGSAVPLGNSDFEVPPAVAYGGGCHLVVWFSAHAIWAKRITPAGVVLDSAPLRMPELEAVGAFADVAFGDSAFLVAWTSYGYSLSMNRGTASTPAIHGCRITPNGAILDSTPLQLAVSPILRPLCPRIAFDGTNFLVARRDGDDVYRCTRVATNGSLLDTADITLGTATQDYYPTPEVAFGSGVYFVVDNTVGSCWRVSPDGYLIDSVPHSQLQYPHVVFDGTDFMLVSQFEDTTGKRTGALGAIRITPEGRVLDSAPFILVAPESAFARASGAAVSVNAANRVGVVFESDEPSPYLTDRIRAATFPAIVGIGSQRDPTPPAVFRVQPNPASKLASLSFNLTQAGPVQVTAFDATGRKCASLFSGRMKAGAQTLPLDTRRLANGVYFLRLEAGTARHSTRLVVSR
jgi:hypothetical protein